MDFVADSTILATQRTSCMVVGVYEGGRLSPAATALDAALDDALSEALRRGDHEGELGTTLLLSGMANAACERVLLVGLGPEPEFVESSYHAALAAATRALSATGAADATLCMSELAVNDRDDAWKIEQAVLAV